MMDKKGVLVFEIGLWIMRVIMVIVIIMGVALMIRTYVDARVNLDVAEPALIMQVIGSSPAFLYMDASGTYHRIVSLERFVQSEPLLNLAFSYGQRRHAAAKISLLEQDGSEIKSVFLNPGYYDELSSQVALLKGISVVRQERQWPVMIAEKGRARQGILKVEVVQPA